jgi:hypothetical protein
MWCCMMPWKAWIGGGGSAEAEIGGFCVSQKKKNVSPLDTTVLGRRNEKDDDS